jgi:hypothetical protein
MSSHPFDARDIRRGMDVYTEDGQYLGTVLHVERAPAPTPPPRHPVAAFGGFTGEALGPEPTVDVGNAGPLVQRRQTDFQSHSDGAEALRGSMSVGRWFGLLGRRNVPLSAVQNVSMERVMLVGGAEI